MANVYKCTRCDYVCATSEMIAQHIDDVHGGIGMQLYNVVPADSATKSTAAPVQREEPKGRKILGTVALAMRRKDEGLWALYFTSDEIIVAKIVTWDAFKKDATKGIGKRLALGAVGGAIAGPIGAGLANYASHLKSGSRQIPMYMARADELASESSSKVLASDATNFILPYADIVKVAVKRGAIVGTSITITSADSDSTFMLINKLGGIDEEGYIECLKTLKSFLPDKVRESA